MARTRCKWETLEVFKMYTLQKNNYEEIRILMCGTCFRTFHGQNAHKDARNFWNNIKSVNA